MVREFAPDYPRDEHGWVDFGRDIELRRELFPPEAFEHPAKANLFMVKEMGRYLTEPGQTVLDPFGGTGSQLISALDGRRVALIELEPYFLDIQKATLARWDEQGRDHAECFLYLGDCKQELAKMQFLCDAAVFSPPYSTTMASTGLRRSDETDEEGTNRYKTAEYTRSPMNLSRLNPFHYTQIMRQVLGKLFLRIAPGGRICIISKDRVEGPRRILFSDGLIKMAQGVGFQYVEMLKHRPPSYIAQGSAAVALKRYGKEIKVVLDEDLIIFRKPL